MEKEEEEAAWFCQETAPRGGATNTTTTTKVTTATTTNQTTTTKKSSPSATAPSKANDSSTTVTKQIYNFAASPALQSDSLHNLHYGSSSSISGKSTGSDSHSENSPGGSQKSSSGHSLAGSTHSETGERRGSGSGGRAFHPDLDQGHLRRAADANGFSPTRLQYLKAMSQIKGAAKRIEREEKVQVLRRLGDFFSESDNNSDGQLTITELTRSLRRAGYRGSEAEIKKFFRLADVSDDQLISKEEFMNVMMKAPTLVHREMTMRRVFTKFDKDGNGSIDKDELKLVFEELGKLMPEDEITRMMSMADKDDSGALEYEEFIEIVIGNRKRREEYERSKSTSQDSS